ncbi:MAG: HEAT repeat domain-containing protein [Lyngbya sp. HA4199-MV5]|jgi:HEAT repeat protein/energy-coupling factor transporter ATP-binding protein EcfA2|nr:HEAT repeat domain-containing protein [Lyngbya sp. HA4199-MV5]
MVFESIAGGLVKAALPKVAGAIATAVKDKLHPTQLQRSLTVALQESGAFDRGQKANNRVFYYWEPGRTDKFLAALLEHSEVQRELQKPLEQDGAPDVAMLVQVAKHIAVDLTLDISGNTLEPWLKAFANAYFDAITAIRFQVAKANYLKQLANWFDDVKFAGVAVPGQDVERAERLAQIFVMPDVEEDGGGRSRLAFERSLFEEQGEQGRQGELLQEQRWRAQLERSGRKFSARQLLNQHQKKIVLLGAPGSGKTTLMSFFAVALAEQQGAIAYASDVHAEGLMQERSPNPLKKGASETPPFLRGARGDQDFKHQPRMVPDTEGIDAHAEGTDRDQTRIDHDAEGSDRDRSQMQRDRTRMVPNTEGLRLDPLALQTDADALLLPILIRIRDWARTPDVTLPEYARQFAETTMSCKPLPKGFFEHWLNNGRALILLDGLDEVAEEAKRYHLVQCIENFLGQYPLNRAIITSRPAGYKRDFFRTEEFPHYELQPFDDGKIEEFCDRWYRSRIQDTAEAQRRKESLQKALNQQDRIKLLARNPLLLTIIALIHRYQARLPRERYKLYDKAVETLLTAWDDNKELSNQTVLKYLQLDDLRRLMESLANWIHTQGNTGDREGGTLIDKDELIQKLCQEIKTLKQLQHYEAKAEAERFVRFIRDRTGLLNEQGQDCYAFVHKTFQEYLTAQDINYQADNEDDFAIVLTHIEQHLHDPHWREVLLLLIAQQSPKKAARAIRKILNANSPYEQWLHRDVLFAGRCLAEDPKGLQGADFDLASEILEQLLKLEINILKTASSRVRSQVSYVICNLGGTTFENIALQALNNQSKLIHEYRLCKYRGVLGEEKEIEYWIELTKNSDANVRSKAADVLCVFRSPDIPTKLSNSIVQSLRRLIADDDSNVRVMAAHTLTHLGETSSDISQALTALLNDKNSDVRSKAIHTLGSFNDASDQAAQALITLLKDENSDIRAEAVVALGELGNKSNIVLQELLAKLDDKDLGVQFCTSMVLRNLGLASKFKLESNPEIKELLEFLTHENYSISYSACERLGGMSNISSEVLKTLLALLEHSDYVIRSHTSAVLSNLGKKNGLVEPAIVQWIEQHQDEECVGAGIDALWEIVEGKG